MRFSLPRSSAVWWICVSLGRFCESLLKINELGSSHSALMPASWITLAHFVVYSGTNLANSAAELGKGARPKSARRAFSPASAKAAFTSLLRMSTISGGVFFGAPIPFQLIAS